MPSELPFSSSDSHSAASGPSPVAPLATAGWCARQGWPVLPLAHGRKTPAANCANCRAPGHTYEGCPCPDAGRWCHGFRSATLDAGRIARWWGDGARFGVGVACGPAALVVIDVDAHPDRERPPRDRLLPGVEIGETVDLTGLATGFHTLAVLAALRGHPSPAEDATTLRVRTPSGGMHIWYRVMDGRRWQCSTGSTRGRALAWQVDVRAHGGYIVAPGTTTAAGTYTVAGEVRRPAPLPGWLAAELERTSHAAVSRTVPESWIAPPRARQAVAAAGGGRDRAARVLASVLAEVAACGAVAEGSGFTDRLNRAAFTAGGLVAGGHLSFVEAYEALRRVAEAARPQRDRHVERIVKGGLEAGARRPLYFSGRP